MYKITVKKSAAKQIKRLSKINASKVISAIKKLQGNEELWRIRTGNYRIIYSIEDSIKIIDVIQVSHPKDVYRTK